MKRGEKVQGLWSPTEGLEHSINFIQDHVPYGGCEMPQRPRHSHSKVLRESQQTQRRSGEQTMNHPDTSRGGENRTACQQSLLHLPVVCRDVAPIHEVACVRGGPHRCKAL